MNKKITKIISRGLQDIIVQKLNGDCTAYAADSARWQGETEMVFTPSRNTELLPSGNDPAWGVVKGPVVGTVKLTLYDIAVEDMENLLSVKYDAEEGVCVGDTDDEDCFIGMSFDQLISKNGAQSNNKTILYKVLFDLPEINAKTIAEGDNAISKLELTGKAYPVFFSKKNGETGSRTYCIVNSVTNKAKYDANKTSIVFPTEFNSLANKDQEPDQDPNKETT